MKMKFNEEGIEALHEILTSQLNQNHSPKMERENWLNISTHEKELRSLDNTIK